MGLVPDSSAADKYWAVTSLAVRDVFNLTSSYLIKGVFFNLSVLDYLVSLIES